MAFKRPWHGRPFGPLRFDQAALPAAAHPVGEFVVAWQPARGGRVLVTHQARPAKVLWATVPGRGFAAAARGVERVTESRSHFSIVDTLKVVCAEQHIDQILAADGALVIAGRLSARRGAAQVGYTLTFAACSANQLGFTLALADPSYNRTYLTYAVEQDEHFFGFGVQFSHFDMKGRRLPIFVQEQGIGRGAQPITLAANLQAGAGGAWHTSYACVPHYITSHLRSLFLTSYEYAVFDLRRADQAQIELFASTLPGRIVHGDRPADLIAEYTSFAGRMRPLPEWVGQGAIVGIQGGSAAVGRVVDRLDAHDVPLAAVWLQDWVGRRTTSFGSQLWWNWELDQTHYPGWDGLLARLRARGVRVLTYLNPYVVELAGRPGVQRDLFREAAERGYLVQDASGAPYRTRITDFSASLVDLTNPAACDWLKAVILEQVLAAGADGWMADFGEGLPYDGRLFSGEPAARYHNQYPEAWARLNRAAIEASGRGDELVFFVRSAYRHSPGHASLFWLGDQLVSWDAHDGIKTAVVGLLSGGLSGFSLNHSDIGGYTTITHRLLNHHRSNELLLRWIELNAFTCVFRTHEGNRPEANAQVYQDDATLAHFGRFARVYRAWDFYRRQLVQEAAATGLPVVRHLFIHYPHDQRVYGLSYQQFMVGAEFMVVPALDPGVASVAAYLPAGGWIHLWSGAAYQAPGAGRTVTIAAPIGQPAVFYRAGSAVGAEFVARLRQAGVMP